MGVTQHNVTWNNYIPFNIICRNCAFHKNSINDATRGQNSFFASTDIIVTITAILCTFLGICLSRTTALIYGYSDITAH